MVVENEQHLLEGWRFAVSQQKVIYGALKKERIWRKNTYWADFVQEGFLVYAQRYVTYRQAHEDFELAAFNLYAFQAIRWHIRNLLRRDQWLQSHSQVCLDDDETPTPAMLISAFPADQVLLMDAIRQGQVVLTKRQRLLLQRHFLAGEKLSQLATEFQVTPRTLRNDRRVVLTVLRSLLH